MVYAKRPLLKILRGNQPHERPMFCLHRCLPCTPCGVGWPIDSKRAGISSRNSPRTLWRLPNARRSWHRCSAFVGEGAP